MHASKIATGKQKVLLWPWTLDYFGGLVHGKEGGVFLFLAREVAERLATTTMYSSPPPMKPSNRGLVLLGWEKLTVYTCERTTGPPSSFFHPCREQKSKPRNSMNCFLSFIFHHLANYGSTGISTYVQPAKYVGQGELLKKARTHVPTPHRNCGMPGR